MTDEVGPSLTVIEGDGDAAVLSKRPRARYCDHRRFELDGTSRRVYCADCQQEIDAWSALETITSMIERMNARYKHAKAEATRAEARLEELKRQERNARARLRRLV